MSDQKKKKGHENRAEISLGVGLCARGPTPRVGGKSMISLKMRFDYF